MLADKGCRRMPCGEFRVLQNIGEKMLVVGDPEQLAILYCSHETTSCFFPIVAVGDNLNDRLGS